MKTSYGEEIQVGSLLKSGKYVGGVEVHCIDIKDKKVYLASGVRGDKPIVLDQETLDESFWKISGFKKIGE